MDPELVQKAMSKAYLQKEVIIGPGAYPRRAAAESDVRPTSKIVPICTSRLQRIVL